MTRSRPLHIALQAALPLSLVLLWWWTSEGSTSIYYPPLSDIVASLRGEWLFDGVRAHLLPSLQRFAVGYAAAAVLGIAFGTLLGLAPRLRAATQPVTEFLRAIPPPLLLPFAIVSFGINDTSKIVVIVLGSVWPVLLNTADGVRGVDPLMLDMAKSYGIPRHRQLRHVVLPGASPQIAVGLRTALAVALILMIISEMVGSTSGLGYRVLAAQRSFDTPGMFAGIIVIGLVGLVVNAAFVAGESRIMRWHRGARGLLDDRKASPRAAARSRRAATDDRDPARAADTPALTERATPEPALPAKEH